MDLSFILNNNLYRFQSNKITHSLYNKAYYECHKDEITKKARKYYYENLDKVKTNSKIYRTKVKIKNKHKYICNMCKFSSHLIYNYNRHTTSKKHLLNLVIHNK